MPLSPKTRLGQYEIVGPLGAGGMGEVYHAHDPRLNRRVAVKVLPAQLTSDLEARERLRREALAVASLEHPFICKVHDIAEDGETLFMVMEYIDGVTLRQRLRETPFSVGEAVRIAGEVAEALEAAHQRGFVHRDLKPANVMLTPDGHVKVMDFGLAKRVVPARLDEEASTLEASLTTRGKLVGTLDYMSPEQIRGELLDQRSDLFSFGILLCELLTTAHPFRRGSATDTLAAILRDAPNLSGDLPQGLMVLIRRLLAKTRQERYASMSDVRADMGRLNATSLITPVAASETRIPLIGRDQERLQLVRLLEEAMAGRGCLVLIGGEPGIGKTHLTRAILEEARQRGALALIGHCYEMEGAPPYIPFVEMLEYSARVAPRDSFRYAIGDAAPEVAKLMPELRDIYPDIPPAIQLPLEQQRRFLFNSYRSFLERSASVTPIIAVFEDLHWADESTLLLLQHLAQNVSTTPVLMIGTYRDMEVEGNAPLAKIIETNVRQNVASRISLRRLTVDGVESMLAALSKQTPPSSLARVVFEETDGNPFFVEEVFRHLAEEGKLFNEKGAWRPGLRVDQLRVPESVRLVLRRRLDRLGDQARRVLTTAAVIGRSFSLRLLTEVESKQTEPVLEAVEEAERAHLVVAEPAVRDTRYRFVHELVRQTLAEALSLPRRQRLHARVAEAIEAVYAESLEPQTSALAHHLYQAGPEADLEKTTVYLDLAARNARLGAAHEDALTHLDHALALREGEESARVAELREQRAGTLLSLGKSQESVEAYRQAIAMFEASGEPGKAAETCIALANLQTWRVECPPAISTIEHAMDHLRPDDVVLRCRVMLQQAMCFSGAGDVVTATRILQQAEVLRQAINVPQIHALAETMTAIVLFHSAQVEPCVEAAARAAAIFRAAREPWFVSEVEWLQLMALFCGRPGEAVKLVAEASDRAERIGHFNALWCCNLFRWGLSLARGNLAEAEQQAQEFWAVVEAQQVPYRFLDYVGHGTIAFLRGNPKEAERLLRHAVELEKPCFLSGLQESSLFCALAELGDEWAWKLWTARRWKLPVAGQLNPYGSWLGLDKTVQGMASLGKREEAAVLQPLTEEMVATGAWAFFPASPFHTSAGIAAACGRDWTCSAEHHLAAIQLTGTPEYRVSQPMARAHYADMLLARDGAGDRTKARVLLSEALALYESMEMPFHAQRTSAKLAEL